jgi:hypothetical protein
MRGNVICFMSRVYRGLQTVREDYGQKRKEGLGIEVGAGRGGRGACMR